MTAPAAPGIIRADTNRGAAVPIHDWTRVDAGVFHDFHQDWIQAIKHALNRGVLPAGYYAISEQSTAHAGDGLLVPDVLALELNDRPADGGDGGLLLAPPRASVTDETDADPYPRRQNVVAVRRRKDERVVAVVEIVSSGNKSSRRALGDFLDKVGDLLAAGVHVLLVDLHPPTARDPDGVHGAVWGLIGKTPYAAPPGRPLTVASYECTAAGTRTYVEPLAVGDALPAAPLFLRPGGHIKVPLEATYLTTWGYVQPHWQQALEAPG